MSIQRTVFIRRVIAVSLVLVVVAFPGSGTILMTASELDAVLAQPSLNVGRQLVTENEALLAEIYQTVTPSVVSIQVRARRPDTGFFDQEGVIVAGGTGFVYDQEGHIITNNHVVDGATRIEVYFLDGTIVRGEILGLDPESDLAVLQVDLPPEKLHPVEFADSEELKVGQMALAIGSPFGQDWTLTSGIISALDRTISSLTQFKIGPAIQTDTPINPGNSGGPLLDLQGRVIGVNSQIISGSRSSAGIGFAIPSNLTQRVARELIDSGFVSYSYLGISGGAVNLLLIDALELPNDLRGVFVAEVVPGGPAARAGLQNASEETVEVDGESVPVSADIITAINSTPLTGMDTLISYLAKNTVPGDEVTLTILRDGETFDTMVKLIPRP